MSDPVRVDPLLPPQPTSITPKRGTYHVCNDVTKEWHFFDSRCTLRLVWNSNVVAWGLARNDASACCSTRVVRYVYVDEIVSSVYETFGLDTLTFRDISILQKYRARLRVTCRTRFRKSERLAIWRCVAPYIDGQVACACHVSHVFGDVWKDLECVRTSLGKNKSCARHWPCCTTRHRALAFTSHTDNKLQNQYQRTPN